MGFTQLKLAFNLSVHQCRHQNIKKLIQNALQESGLQPQYLEIELIESLLINVHRSIADTLIDLKKSGVKLVFDDFGIGYSNLNDLRKLPIDKLKLDRSIIHDISFDTSCAAIVSVMIAVANSLNLQITAVGVESQDQLEFLKKHKCHEIQGFLISQALSEHDCVKILEKYCK